MGTRTSHRRTGPRLRLLAESWGERALSLIRWHACTIRLSRREPIQRGHFGRCHHLRADEFGIELMLNTNYGLRPLRGTENALQECRLIWRLFPVAYPQTPARSGRGPDGRACPLV